MPHSIAEIFSGLRELGAVTGHLAQTEELEAAAHARLQNVIELTKKAPRRPRVLCLDWIDPYYCCGHWVPEMVEHAGGENALGRKGADSVRVSWTDIAALSPEISIVSPCGFGVEEAAQQARQLLQLLGWNDLPAALNDRAFAVNANAYFARPGPRVVDGVELLAHLIHSELWDLRGNRDAFRFTFPNEKANPPDDDRRRDENFKTVCLNWEEDPQEPSTPAGLSVARVGIWSICFSPGCRQVVLLLQAGALSRHGSAQFGI